MANQPSSDLEVASINRLKIAVATAVIRCKPSQMTTKEFTESLGQKLRKKQSDWKGRAEVLEAELLRTRQELAVSRLRESGQFKEDHDMDWDDTGTESNKDQPGAASSSICPEFAFPTPPSSIPIDPPTESTLENHLRVNTQFLHCVTRLCSLSKTLEHTSSTHMDMLYTVRDTALKGMEHLVNHVSRHLHDNGLPWQLMNDAAIGVARTVEGCASSEIRQELVKGATAFVDELLQQISLDSHLNNHHTQRQLCSLIVSLSTSQTLTPIILNSTLTRIQTVATMLRRPITGTTFNPTLYENSSYLLSVMEDALLSPRTIPSVHTGVDKMRGKPLIEMVDGLENCLLHISDEFPLFCQHIWRVVSILDWLRCRSRTEGQLED